MARRSALRRRHYASCRLLHREYPMSSYGSENPDCVGVDRLHDVPPRLNSSIRKKAALATAGAALFLGGALVMYEGWNSPFSGAKLATMNLESAGTTDYTNLMSGKEVLLRIKGKTANLCADDGGGTKADETYVTGQPCNPSNSNQLFIYDSTTYQFKSTKKHKLCLDNGDGWAGFTWLRLSKCDTKNEHQRFSYDSSKFSFENPSKSGYCMDDGGATSAGASHFTIWPCDSKTDNQRFEVVSQAALAEEQKKVLDAVASGAKFVLRIAGKDGMCVSGSGPTAASTSFVALACDKQSKNQLFTYDASTKRFKSSEKSNLCLDDGGGTKAAKTDVRLATCSSSSADQSFVYASSTLMFSQPNKANLCLDDGSGIWFTAPRLILKECDPYSKNQHFEYVLQTDPVSGSTNALTTSVDTISRVIPASEKATSVAAAASPLADSTTTTTSGQTSTAETPSKADTTSRVIPASEKAKSVAAVASPIADWATTSTSAQNTPSPEATPPQLENLTPYQAEPHSGTFQSQTTTSAIQHDEKVSTDTLTKPPLSIHGEGPATTITESHPGLSIPERNSETNIGETYPGLGISDVDLVRQEENAIVTPQLTNADDVAPPTDVEHQFMTKLDFYYEIKNHFAETTEKLIASTAVTHLRLEDTKDLEQKMRDCIDEASEKFGYRTSQPTTEHLKAAIAWVQETCINP